MMKESAREGANNDSLDNPFETPVSVDFDPVPESARHPIRDGLVRISIVCLLIGLGLGLFFATVIFSLTPISIGFFLLIVFLPGILGGLLALGGRALLYLMELVPQALVRSRSGSD